MKSNGYLEFEFSLNITTVWFLVFCSYDR